MTPVQFDKFRNAMELHLSFKLHFDRSQALVDMILKSNNDDAIKKLIDSAHSYSVALESIIANTLVSDEKQ